MRKKKKPTPRMGLRFTMFVLAIIALIVTALFGMYCTTRTDWYIADFIYVCVFVIAFVVAYYVWLILYGEIP